MAYRPKGAFEHPIHTSQSSPFRKSSTAWAVSACIASMALSACGGGAGESSAGASGISLSGQAVKGPVSGGQVCAYTLQTPRQQIACATTDSQANYQLQLPAGTGEVLLEVTRGSYVDEATGKTVNLTSPLRTVTKAGAVLENVLLTPFTELAVQRAAAAHPAGQLSLVNFQSKINELETGLGLSGLADGKPFGGNSTQDTNHQKALAAFAKLQAGHGKDVGAPCRSWAPSSTNAASTHWASRWLRTQRPRQSGSAQPAQALEAAQLAAGPVVARFRLAVAAA